MRNFANLATDLPKWIVLDGDVDPEWIESLNTVMDDNKMLTLASNERIALNPTMRLIVEVADLRNATPATVSRGGVLFVNERDIGWKPYADSWVDGRQNVSSKNMLTLFFSNYVEATLDYMKRNIKAIAPVQEINMVFTICWLLEALLDETKEMTKEMLELYFVFCCVWGFGSALGIDKGIDYRKTFSDYWKLTWTEVKFGDNMVFDYMIDADNNCLIPWDGIVPSYGHVPDAPFSSIMVSTVDSTRMTFLTNCLVGNRHPVMFVGLAGTGKTTLVKEKLKNLEDDWSSATIAQNSKTDALVLQTIMEQSLEKRAGRTYAPIGNKRHIYFIDDLNMPGLDKYGTQSPIELLCQLIDHEFFYDRNKCGLVKEIRNVQFLAAMNPTAGSFVINGRLQRQFTCFACGLPTSESIEMIYLSILRGHLSSFDTSVQNIADKIVSATIYLHNTMLKDFLRMP
jgi:dynein heavy chain